MHTKLLETEEDVLALRSAMGHEGARRIFQRILSITGIRHDTFHPDPYIHAQRAGIKTVGLQLEEALLRASPEIYKSLFLNGDPS